MKSFFKQIRALFKLLKNKGKEFIMMVCLVAGSTMIVPGCLDLEPLHNRFKSLVTDDITSGEASLSSEQLAAVTAFQVVSAQI